jgi:hypothetical protein
MAGSAEIRTTSRATRSYELHLNRGGALEARFWAQNMPLKCRLAPGIRELCLPWQPFSPALVLYTRDALSIPLAPRPEEG